MSFILSNVLTILTWVSVKFFLILNAESLARVFSNQHSCITCMSKIC